MAEKKIVITEENIKDKFVCYGHYDAENPRCDAFYCPWSSNSTCPDNTKIRKLRMQIERMSSK